MQAENKRPSQVETSPSAELAKAHILIKYLTGELSKANLKVQALTTTSANYHRTILRLTHELQKKKASIDTFRGKLNASKRAATRASLKRKHDSCSDMSSSSVKKPSLSDQDTDIEGKSILHELLNRHASGQTKTYSDALREFAFSNSLLLAKSLLEFTEISKDTASSENI